MTTHLLHHPSVSLCANEAGPTVQQPHKYNPEKHFILKSKNLPTFVPLLVDFVTPLARRRSRVIAVWAR